MGGIWVSYPIDIHASAVRDQLLKSLLGMRMFGLPAPGISRSNGVAMPTRCSPRTNFSGLS